MKKTSLCEMYVWTMACHVFVFILGIGCICTMLVQTKKLDAGAERIFWLIFFTIVIIGCILFSVSVAKVIITLLKDYDAVKNNKALSITGKVLGFKRNRNPETGTQINNEPIIMIIDTEEEIILKINDRVTVGETYKFKYLKYSKLAEVVEKM